MTTPEQAAGSSAESRCPQCDAALAPGAEHCLMCGLTVGTVLAAQETAVSPASFSPAVMASTMREKQSRSTQILTAVFALIILILGGLVLRYQGPALSVALVPTVTPIPPTITHTPTWTPVATNTSAPTEIPTITPTPAPTDTPQPPRFHTVSGGETLFGLAQRFRISAESIASTNGFTVETPIQTGQSLEIPWPTATPPLQAVAFEINGQPAVARVENCEMVTIKAGDTASTLAVVKDVPLQAIVLVNRETQESIQLLQPGDTLCIPEIVYGGVLPPTPGPSPTPSPTSFPAGPHLLYPVDGTVIEAEDTLVTLQWVAVKDLDDAEWYMVELVEAERLDAFPRRGFTRDNAFQLPDAWRPFEPESRQFRWRVSVIQVTDWRADGLPIYTYGGDQSREISFYWIGSPRTPTPMPTAVSTP